MLLLLLLLLLLLFIIIIIIIIFIIIIIIIIIIIMCIPIQSLFKSLDPGVTYICIISGWAYIRNNIFVGKWMGLYQSGGGA